ncbi:MAG: hypothetical protein ACO32U_03815, partial [Candidatus Limnocylindrus sp.]
MSDQGKRALLAGLLPRTSIEVGVRAGDWEAAVLAANEMLVRSGAVERGATVVAISSRLHAA